MGEFPVNTDEGRTLYGMATASLYVRLSREARETNLSLSGMMDDVRALAEREGYAVLAEHVDDGISGAVRDRPEFRAWLEDASSGRVDALVTFHADRLTREGVNAAALILDTIEGKDPFTGRVVRDPVRLVSVDGLDSKEAESFRWRFVIAAEVARAERERMKARNVSARKRLDAAGRWAGGSVPFGTRVVDNPAGSGKVLVRDEVESALLEEIAARLIRGESLREVCRSLNASGSRTRRGLEWQRSSLLGTIRSKTTRDLVLPPSTIRAVLEQVGPDRRSRERSGPKRGAGSGGRPQAYLLAGGLGVCDGCGRRLTTAKSNRTGAAYIRYRCSSVSEGQSCGAGSSIDAPKVDAWIEAQVVARFAAFEFFEPRVIVSGGEDLDGAERALEDAQAALLTSPSPEALAAYQEAQERLQAVSGEPRTREEVLVPTGRSIAEEWQARDVSGRADLLADFLSDPVRLYPNPGGRGGSRHGIKFEERLFVPWRGEF